MMADHSSSRRRRSPESSVGGSRRKERERERDPRREPSEIVYEDPRMGSGPPHIPIDRGAHNHAYGGNNTYLSSSSSSNSSYELVDISRTFPANRSGIKTFFTAPSEHRQRKLRRRKSNRIFKLNNSSSSSVNSDLAYGTGYIKRSKLRRVRSKEGKIIDKESYRYSDSHRTKYGESSSRYVGSEKRGYGSGSERRGYASGSERRGNTEAEILAVGAGLAALAREQNKYDLKNRNGKSPQLAAVKQSSQYGGAYSGSRGLGSSKVSHGLHSSDEDGWESASDAESEDSVDSRLAFGAEASGWWGKQIHRPMSRKNTVVDPRLFGPENSLHGFVDEPVGFGTVTWTSTEDFGQQYRAHSVSVGPNESFSGSQASLQQVFPVQNSRDPTRFDAARNSVASGSEPFVTNRPGPAPLQHPQPYTPVSQSIYEPSDPTGPDLTGVQKPKKPTSSSGRSNSLAQAALVGVAGAAVGAVIASRHDGRKESRREDDRDEASRISSRRRGDEREEASRINSKRREEARDDSSQITPKRKGEDRDNSSRVGVIRRDSDKKEGKDERRKDKRDSPERDDRKDKRRDKDRKKDGSRYSDEERREKKREKRRDEVREETREHREKRREKEDRRAEKSEVDSRPETGHDERRSKSEAAITTVSKIDPFMFQVADNAFPTPMNEYTESHQRHGSIPQVVTVERVPDFSRGVGSSSKDQSSAMVDYDRDYSRYDDRDTEYCGSVNDHGLHEAEAAYRETELSTAPIAAGAIGAAAAVVAADLYRERSEKRRNERRSAQSSSDYNDRDYESRGREPVKERDPIQEEADRAYREIVMARKIASQVIRSRSNSPDRSVVGKYSRKEEPEEVQIVTPPEMDHPKIKGPYDAPNADFNPDHHFDDPRELRYFRPETPVIYGGYKDPQATLPRPLLNLVRPTPVPSPLPERQASKSEKSRSEKTRSQPAKSEPSRSESARSEPSSKFSKSRDRSDSTRSESGRPEAARSEPPTRSSKSRDRSEKTRTAVSEVGRNNGMDSPTSSTISKGVTWGENETKHFDVESPSDHREEYISSSDVPAYEKFPQPTSRSEPKSDTKPSKGWGAIAAALVGAGAGAAATSSTDTSESRKSKSNSNERENSPPNAYEYRGVVIEPESPQTKGRRRSPPSPSPKPTSPSSHMPGAFADDSEFTAVVAAGLKDAGFNDDIVIEDPDFRKRSSPPGSNESVYQAPYSETVSDLGHIPATASRISGSEFFMGDAPSTSQDPRSISPGGDEFTTKLSKKEQKKRDKGKRQSVDVLPPAEETPTTKEHDQDFYFNEPTLSKKDQKKREKEAKRQSSLAEDITPIVEPIVAREVFEEPETYFETSKKKKKSKRDSAVYEDDAVIASPTASTSGRRVSIPVDAFDDLQNAGEDWTDTKKPKSKSKRDSERFDSPSRLVAAFDDVQNEGDDWTDTKKSKSKSKRDSERFDSPSRSVVASETSERSSSKRKDKSRSNTDEYDRDPAEISLPPVTPSEASQDRDYDESRTSRKSRDSSIYDSRDRSVVSEAASRYEDEPRKKKKSSRSSTRDKDDFDDTRSVVSVASAPAGDDERKSKKKDKEKKGGGFFGLFGSKSESGAREESPKGSKDDFDDAKSKKKKKRNSMPDASSLYGDLGSASVGDLSRSTSNGHGSSRYDDDDEARSDGERKKSRSRANSASSKRESFLGNTDTHGARVGSASADTAIAHQLEQPNADDAYEEALHGDRLDRNQGNVKRDISYDPEIVQRHFRPSIDPQYGDLLPLPPSEPPTPGNEDFEELPGLPESRPDTPEDERLMKERLRTSTRKLYETPIKSPSHSAVPINFRMGKGKISAPSSPGLPRASPLQSPATTNTEAFSFQRNTRNRPTSWESAKEYRPLYLPESVRRGSNVRVSEEEEEEANMQELPASMTSSVISSRHDLEDSSSQDEFHDFPAESAEQFHDPLSINTGIGTYEYSGLLDSQQSTPKAKFTFDNDEKPGASSQEHSRDMAVSVIAGAALVGTAAYLASNQQDAVDQPDSIERQPSPIEPMSKDRSSYLLQSSPMSIKDDITVDSPPQNKSSLSAVESLDSIQEGDRERTLEVLTGGTWATEEAETDDFLFSKSKKDKKKDKKKGKLSRSNTQDDFAFAEPAVIDAPEAQREAVPDPEDEFFAPKSKKDKKKSKLSRSTTQEEFSLPEASTMKMEAVNTAEVPSQFTEVPEDEFSAPKSKRDKKKGKLSRSATQEDLSLSEPVPVEIAEIPGQPMEVPDDDFATPKSKDKKKDKKNAKSLPAWETDGVNTSSLADIPNEKSLAVDSEKPSVDEIPAAIVAADAADDFFTPSKKDKKKNKKQKSEPSWEPEPERDIVNSPPEASAHTSGEAFDNTSTPAGTHIPEDLSISSNPNRGEGEQSDSKTVLASDPVLTPAEKVTENLPVSNRDMNEEPNIPVNFDEDQSQWATGKSKKEKKDKKGKSKMNWYPEPEESQQVASEPLPEPSRELGDDVATPVEPEALDDSFSFKSKDKKKDKKNHKLADVPVNTSAETESEATPQPDSVVETPLETLTLTEPEALDQSLFVKSKKDKKKDKKKAKFADDAEPDITLPQESAAETPFENSTSVAEENDDFFAPNSKKDKKKDKKKGKLTDVWIEPMTGIEPAAALPEESVVGTPFETSTPAIETDDFFTPASKKDKKKDKKKGKTTDADTWASEPVPEIAIQDDQPEFDSASAQDSFHDFPPEDDVGQASKDNSIAETEDISQQATNRATPLVEESSIPDEFSFQESKKGKKKKGKGAAQIEVADEPVATLPRESEDASEFFTPGSKKNKKNGKKTPTLEAEQETTSASPLDIIHNEPASEFQSQDVPSAIKDYTTPTLAKSNKKGKKSETLDVADEPALGSPHTSREVALESQDTITAADTFDDFATPTSKKGKKKGKKAQSWGNDDYPSAPQELATPENFSAKPTPMVGPGGWIETPATASTSTRDESFQNTGRKFQEKDYFSSAILPGAAVLAGAALLAPNDSEAQACKEDPSLESYSEQAAPDGLAAGYRDEQLSLAKQLQEEFTSKKSKKDKKKRQSLPATPNLEEERSRSVENVTDDAPRARSLSVRPLTDDGKPKSPYSEDQLEVARQMKADFEKGSGKKSKKGKKKQHDEWDDAIPEQAPEEAHFQEPVEDVPQLYVATDTLKGDGLTAGYKEDQLELARQLKAEFDKGSNKKSKKDKKKKQNDPSWDDTNPELFVEDSTARELGASEEVTTPDLTIDPTKGDGLSAGYQEDQLSLARQLQADFGKKTPKKDKKRRSTSQTPQTPSTPQNAEAVDDYFGEPSSYSYAEPQAADAPTPVETTREVSDIVPDGLTAGYKEDKLELARQLKEEFGSGSSKKSKKDKKSKKRGNFDDESLPATPVNERQYPSEQDITPSVETPPVVEPEDDLGFSSKKPKKDKKGKKRGNFDDEALLATPVNEQQDPLGHDTQDVMPSIETPLDMEPEDNFGFSSKKSKKGKKGNNRDIASSPGVELGNPLEETAPPNEDPTPVDAEDEFTFTSTKKSKKDKKGKKRDASEPPSIPETPVEETLQLVDEPAQVEDVVRSMDESTPADAEDEFAFTPTKTSKKDKKGKERESSVPPFTQDLPVEQEDIPPVDEPSPIEAEDEFAFTSGKKSKKDKKAKKRDTSEPPSALKHSIDLAPSALDEPSTSENPTEMDIPAFQEPLTGNVEDKYSFSSSKKAKKDKKGKKQDISEPPSEAETPTEMIISTPKEPLAENVNDDFMFTSAKKSKKDKKGKNRDISEAALAPSVEESSPVVEQPVEAVDDFSFSMPKKSKKDKKKRGSLLRHSSTYDDFPDEPVEAEVASDQAHIISSPATPEARVEQTGVRDIPPAEADLPELEQQMSGIPVPIGNAIEPNAVIVPEPVVNYEDVFTSSKMSSESTEILQPQTSDTSNPLMPLDPPSTSISENMELPLPAPDSAQDATTVQPSTIHDVEDSGTGDDFVPKKSKKDKKKKKDLPSDSGEASGISAPLDVTQEAKQEFTGPPPYDGLFDNSTYTDQTREMDLEERPFTQEQKPKQDEWCSTPSRKSSKKDKNRKSGASPPVDIVPGQVPLPEEQPAPEPSISAAIPQEPKDRTTLQDISPPPAEEEVPEVADDEWAANSKKSKKDKKKNRKSGISTPVDDVLVSADSGDMPASFEQSLQSEDLPVIEADPAGDEWGFSSKKSKKETKKQKSGVSTPVESNPVESFGDVPNSKLLSTNEEAVATVQTSDEPSVSAYKAEELVVDEWEALAKKSKKDKKKNRKSGLDTPLETPVEEISEPLEPTGAQLTDQEEPSTSAKEIEPIANPEDIQLSVAEEYIQEPVDDDWTAIPSKQSKKDKEENRDSAISTLSEAVVEALGPSVLQYMIQDAPSVSMNEDKQLSKSEEDQPYTTEDSFQEPFDDEWASTSTKKSKKDKKKGKSGISTPVEYIPEQPEEASAPSETVEFGCRVDDLGRTTENFIGTEPVLLPASQKPDVKGNDNFEIPLSNTDLLDPTTLGQETRDTDTLGLTTDDVAEKSIMPATDYWDTFSTSSKKSKKDKKKNKSGISTPKDDSWETTATPNETEIEVRGIPSEAVFETPAEDDWGVSFATSKKSKKDKKNKSGLSTPKDDVLDTLTSVEHTQSEVPVMMHETVDETPVDDDWSSFAAPKKSKKDKKKNKSGICTPIEDPIQPDIVEGANISTDPNIVPAATESPADEWELPSKKSKKDKKNHKSGISTPIEVPIKDDIFEEAHRAVEPVESSVSLEDLEPVEPLEPAADEWSLSFKKSKKDKKKNKSDMATPIEYSVQADIAEEAERSLEPVETMESIAASQVPEPVTDEWALPSKKSKKDKKKNKSGTATPIAEFDTLDTVNEFEAPTETIAAPESSPNETVPDERAMPSKSKKDKKNRSDVSTPLEEPEMGREVIVDPVNAADIPDIETISQQPAEIEESTASREFVETPAAVANEPAVQDIVQDLSQIEDPAVDRGVFEEPIDEWSSPAKKSKRDKKDKKNIKSGLSTPNEEFVTRPTELTMEDKIPAPSELENTIVKREVAQDEIEDWSLPSKKSKKDKSKSRLFTPIEEPFSSAHVPDTKSTAQTPFLPDDSVPVQEVVPGQVDEWSVPSEKSKKDKKKQKSGFSTPIDEPAEAFIMPITEDVTQGSVAAVEPAHIDREPADEWSMPSKKSKKDKKKQKSGLSTPIEEVSSFTTQQQMYDEPAKSLDSVEATENAIAVKAYEPEQPATETVHNFDENAKGNNFTGEIIAAGATAALIAGAIHSDPISTDAIDKKDEPVVEEWDSFSAKKSKKDKKKKSGSATPTREVVDDTIAPQTIGATAKHDADPIFSSTDAVESAAAEAAPQEAEEEWGSFSLKKSKKDKKSKGKQKLITKELDDVQEPAATFPVLASPMEVFETPMEEITEPILALESHRELDDLIEPVSESPMEVFQTPFEEIPEPALSNEVVQEPANEWNSFTTSKQSKKDKKELGKKNSYFDKQEQVTEPLVPVLDNTESFGVPSEGIFEPALPLTPQEAAPSQNLDESSEILKRADLEREPEASMEDVKKPEEPQPSLKRIAGIFPDEAPTSREATEDLEDEWGSVSIRKGKKDKKGKGKNKELFDARDNTIIEQQPVINPIGARNEPIALEETPVQDFEAIPPEQDEQFGSFSLKKSKKDKKKRKSGISTPMEEKPSPIEPELTKDSMEGVGTANDNITSTPFYAEPEDLETPVLGDSETVKETNKGEPPEEYTFTSKKSKKDKKGKRGSRVDAFDVSTGTIILAEAEASTAITQQETTSTSKGISFDDMPVSHSVQSEDNSSLQPGRSRSSSMTEKRKRLEAIDADLVDESNSSQALVTSWADEVEEAEVERALPVIEEIDHDQSLSHIAKTTEAAPVDDFFRPNKKGKKGKKTKSIDNSRAPVSFDPSKKGSTKEESGTGELVAGAAIIGGAALGSGFAWKSSETKKEPVKELVKEERPEAPERKLSKKEKRKQSIDKRTPTNDIFDHDALWEGADPKEFEETAPIEDDDHDDGFWSPPQQESFQTAETSSREPTMSRGSTMGNEHEDSSGPSTLSMERPLSPPDDLTCAEILPQDATFSSSMRGPQESENQEPGFVGPAVTSRDIPSDPLPIGRNPFRSSGKFARSGFSDLPILEEETQLDPEYFPPPQFHSDDPNRDSAFVTDSPNPNQGAFVDNKEHIRDSGVHLRDLSPAPPRTPISTSDAAISRLAWPEVDEESETVYLDKAHDHNVETPDKKDRRTHRGEEFYKPKDEANRGFEVYQTKEKSNRSNELYLPKSEQVKEFFTPPRAEAVERMTSHREASPSSRDLLPSQRVKEERHSDLHRTSTIHGHGSDNLHEHYDKRSITDKHSSQGAKSVLAAEIHRSQTPHRTEDTPHAPREEATGTRGTSLSTINTGEHTSPRSAETPRKPVEDSLVKKRLQKFETPEVKQSPKLREGGSVKDRVQRLQSPEIATPSRSKEESYSELSHLRRPKAEQPQGISDNTIAAGAAIAGAATLGFAAARQLSQEKRPGSATSTRSASNTGINRLRTPTRPDSVNSIRTSTPPLRRSDRKISGDLRSLSQRSQADLAKEAELAAITSSAVNATVNTPTPLNPTANEGRVRSKDMADVYVS
jgi:hypothetical protein